MASKRVVLKFPRHLVDQPIVCDLVKRYDLAFNILKARVTPREEGLLVLEVSGRNGSVENGLDYLAEAGVEVQALSQDITRDEARCTHCGACVPQCPTRALSIERSSMKVTFEEDKCIACELCTTACPVRAMQAHF